MRVNNISKTAFQGALNSKMLLKALETISNHSATFSTSVAVGASMLLRPLAISLTPKVEKENKHHSISNSVASGLIKLLSAVVISAPIEYAVKNIEKNPEKFLKPSSIEFLKDKNVYNLASQTLKFSSSLVSAVPKTILTVSLIPFILKKLFKPAQKPEENKQNLNFTGKLQDSFTKLISKYFNNDAVQNFAIKNKSASDNIARNMTILTDTLLAGSFAINTKRNKKISPERKNNLIYNTLLSTGLSVLAGFGLDKLAQKQGKGMLNKFIEANKDNPKLSTYVQGINVLRPALIFAFVYYGILPIISNYFAQKISNGEETKTQI